MAGALSTDALDYLLPEELIATHPVEPRDYARMLVVRRGDASIEHRHVRDLPEYLDLGDAIVFNDTAVAPARLRGRRSDSGGRVEGLFLAEREPGKWETMLKSNGRLSVGVEIELLRRDGVVAGYEIRLVERGDDGATWTVDVHPADPALRVLDATGLTPLPPYILRARHQRHDRYDDARDRKWYQTVYAEADRRKSVAAPTAGLHFTPALLKSIDAGGAERHTVTLHVGPGTFKPVTTATLAEHHMHTEWYEVPPSTLNVLRARRAFGEGPSRIIAVGTTTVRALESLPEPLPPGEPGEPGEGGSVFGETDLLIAPPYEFRKVDGMLTNFHLPRSTLLALVAAMVGLDRLKTIYGEAMVRGYRFYSYGDAMLILP